LIRPMGRGSQTARRGGVLSGEPRLR